MRDSPPLGSSPFLTGLILFLLASLAGIVLLTGWTAWRVYRQPTVGRLIEHGVLLLLWLWTWVISGPYYQAKWGKWGPALYVGHLALLLGRMLLGQRARKSCTRKPRA
jgi:hypothetical protein